MSCRARSYSKYIWLYLVLDFVIFGTSCSGILAKELRLYSPCPIKKKANNKDPKNYIVTPNGVFRDVTQGCVGKYTIKVPV